MGDLTLTLKNVRFLQEQSEDSTGAIIIVIGGIVLLFIALICFCWKRRGGRQQVEFEIFTNEVASAKESKNQIAGTNNNIAYVSKDLSFPKDEEDINSTSESKKKRRRKRDRIQQQQSHSEEDKPEPINQVITKQAQPDESFDIE